MFKSDFDFDTLETLMNLYYSLVDCGIPLAIRGLVDDEIIDMCTRLSMAIHDLSGYWPEEFIWPEERSSLSVAQ